MASGYRRSKVSFFFEGRSKVSPTYHDSFVDSRHGDRSTKSGDLNIEIVEKERTWTVGWTKKSRLSLDIL
jgi:hypothetical protein